MTAGFLYEGCPLCWQVTCSEPYEWTDPTINEWEFSAAVKARAGSEPFHVSLLPITAPIIASARFPAWVRICAAGARYPRPPHQLLSPLQDATLPSHTLLHQTCWFQSSACQRQVVVAQVVAYDFGIKHNILRRLTSAGCKVTVVPAAWPAQKVLDMNPDGIFLSNGPVSTGHHLVSAERQS